MELMHLDRPFEKYRLNLGRIFAVGRGDGGPGWLLEGVAPPRGRRCYKESELEWREVVEGTQPLSRVTSSSHAELHALRHALSCLFAVVGARRARIAKRAAVAADDAKKARRVSLHARSVVIGT